MEPTTEKLIEKLMAAAWEIASEHGPLSLMAIFEREDGLGLWDLVVSAPWLRDDRDGIYLVAKAVVPRLTQEEALTISRILTQNPNSDFVRYLRSLYAGPANFRDNSVVVGLDENLLVGLGPMALGSVEIRRGYIIQADPATAEMRSGVAVVA